MNEIRADRTALVPSRSADPALRLLARQSRQFLRGDFDSIGNDYDEPIMLVAPHGSSVYADRGAFNIEGSLVRDHFLSRGMTDLDFEVVSDFEWGPDLRALVVVWSYIDARGKQIGARQSTYVFRNHGNDVRIAVHITHTDLHEHHVPGANARHRKTGRNDS